METSSAPNDTTTKENTYVFQLIVHSLVFLFGVPGNCLILRVYWTKTLKSSTQVFIMGLAWADLAVCLLAVHRIYYVAAVSIAGYEVPEFDFIILALGSTSIATSVMMTAVIAADRYDCVCRPHHRFFTHKRGKIAAWSAFVFSLLNNIPAFLPGAASRSAQSLALLQLAFQVLCFTVALVMISLCYSKVYTTIRKHTKVEARSKITTQNCSVKGIANKGNTTLQNSARTNTEHNIHAVSSAPTFTEVPCSSTVADTSLPIDESTLDESGIGRAVPVLKETESRVESGISDPRHHQGNAGRAPRKADAANLQRKTTRMLFITSVVFLLTWLPYWVRVAAEFASYSDPVFYTILVQLSNILYINNVVNPLIYGLANRRFRKDCKTVLSKMKLC